MIIYPYIKRIESKKKYEAVCEIIQNLTDEAIKNCVPLSGENDNEYAKEINRLKTVCNEYLNKNK